MWWLLVLVQALGQAPGDPAPRISQSVVVSAATEPVPLDALARAVTVISGEEVRQLPNSSVADLLRLAGSLEVRVRGGFGAQADVSARGGGFGEVLVLVDGVRLNDSQSGHHNMDVPIALEQIDRIEIVRGTGSSLYGADAMTATINIVTAAQAGARASMAGGDHGLLRGTASFSSQSEALTSTLATWGTRTSGFMFDREVATGGASVTAAFSPHRKVTASHLRSAFGANGFYGPSPSKEWTDQTLVSVADAVGSARRRLNVHAAYRTHGDHFLWDVRRPGFAENRHRTHAVTAGAALRARRERHWTTVGGEIGLDWIRSNNLGNHELQRAGVLLEHQRAVGRRTTLYPSVRYDQYSAFGGSWSPSIAVAVSLSPTVRGRMSAGRAFRIPTFTERYYRDPAHAAVATLGPERGWGYEGGFDLTLGPWLVGVTPFARRQRDVIDWVRTTPNERWETANIHAVRTAGIEAGVTRRWRGGSARAEWTWIDADAPQLTQLSKYVADYARHSVAASATFRLHSNLSTGVRSDCKRKVDGRGYCGVDVRAGLTHRRLEFFVETANVFNVQYQEVIGVDMPPRWILAGVRAGR